MLHIQQMLVKKLQQSFLKASKEGDYKLLETIVLTLGCVGKAANGEQFFVNLSVVHPVVMRLKLSPD